MPIQKPLNRCEQDAIACMEQAERNNRIIEIEEMCAADLADAHPMDAMLNAAQTKNHEIDDKRQAAAMKKISEGISQRMEYPEASYEVEHVLSQLRQLVSDIGSTGRLPAGDIIIKKAKPKVSVSLRIDEDILHILRIEAGAQGLGYQTLINQILRRFSDDHKERLVIQGPVARPVTKRA